MPFWGFSLQLFHDLFQKSPGIAPECLPRFHQKLHLMGFFPRFITILHMEFRSKFLPTNVLQKKIRVNSRISSKINRDIFALFSLLFILFLPAFLRRPLREEPQAFLTFFSIFLWCGFFLKLQLRFYSLAHISFRFVFLVNIIEIFNPGLVYREKNLSEVLSEVGFDPGFSA